MPKQKLVPTLTLRINYILWIEDLIYYLGIDKKNICGIDIGTGASCIFCLLAVRMNIEWKMIALEIDKENLMHATENIQQNKLENQIQVVDQENSENIFEKLFKRDNSPKTFTICNPPFFTTEQDMIDGKNRTGKRRKRGNSSGSKPEISNVEGIFQKDGELGFVTKILLESIKLKDKIEIYSSMFGCLANYQKFLQVLKNHDIKNFTTTKLIQGKVTRWAVAWSFNRNLLSFRNHKLSQSVKPDKISNILYHSISSMDLSHAREAINKILSELKITVKLLSQVPNKLYQFELVAKENTWSKLRRKRRAGERNEESSTSIIKTEQNLIMGFQISKEEDDSIQLQIFYKSGNMSKDCINQILQYLKNNLK